MSLRRSQRFCAYAVPEIRLTRLKSHNNLVHRSLVDDLGTRLQSVLQIYGHPRSPNLSDICTPFHITLVIWVGVRVRVSGDVHITRVLVMGMPIYHSNTGSPTIHINRSIRLCLHYIYWIATAPARQPYRIGLLFTHKNLDFGQIPLKGRNRSVPISKMERHISNMFCATLWCSVNRHSNRSESEQVGA